MIKKKTGHMQPFTLVCVMFVAIILFEKLGPITFDVADMVERATLSFELEIWSVAGAIRRLVVSVQQPSMASGSRRHPLCRHQERLQWAS